MLYVYKALKQHHSWYVLLEHGVCIHCSVVARDQCEVCGSWLLIKGFATEALSTIRKKLVKQHYSHISSTCLHNMVDVGPLTAEISSGVSGIPICWAISKLHASDWRQVGKSLTEFEVFPHQKFLGMGKKFLQEGFQAWPHVKHMCKFSGDPLRDGWDPLSRSLGSKSTNRPTNQPVKKKVLRNNRQPYAGYARQTAKEVWCIVNYSIWFESWRDWDYWVMGITRSIEKWAPYTYGSLPLW